MSVLNVEDKILFIHVPKTAGTSVEEHPKLKPFLFNRHNPISNYADAVDLDEYFKFTFVRNPYDRFASASVNHLLERNFERFNDTLLDNPRLNDAIVFKPMHELTCVYGELEMNYVGKFENLAEDWKQVERVIGEFTLPHLVKGREIDYNKLYTPRLREYVRERYKRDFEIFGYETEN